MKRIAYLSLIGVIAVSACSSDVTSSAKQEIISCDDRVLSESFGFNENVETSTCEAMKVYDMQDYHCSVEQNVFGTSLSAAHVTTDSKSVYAFANAEQCIEGLKKWIELVP